MLSTASLRLVNRKIITAKEISDMKKSIRSKWQINIILVLAIMALAGCQTTSQGGRTVTRDQAQRPLNVYHGTVLSVADVQIQGRETGVGAVGGAVVGGIVGSTIGGGRGRTLATTGGALAGAAGGSAVEQRRATRPGLEIEVELDDGRIMVIVQEKDDEFIVGDRVRLISAPDGTFRVRQ
jgi:outer membrane lipoprotein SlyB